MFDDNGRLAVSNSFLRDRVRRRSFAPLVLGLFVAAFASAAFVAARAVFASTVSACAAAPVSDEARGRSPAAPVAVVGGQFVRRRQQVPLVADHLPADAQPFLQEPVVGDQHSPVLDQHGRVVGIRVPSRAADHDQRASSGTVQRRRRRGLAWIAPLAKVDHCRLHLAQYLSAKV